MSERKKYTKDEIVTQIQNNRAWAVRALMAIYERQTADEQVAETNHIHNGAGFTSFDAPILTSMAKFYEQKHFLTDKQLGVVRKRIVRYHRQLFELANAS